MMMTRIAAATTTVAAATNVDLVVLIMKMYVK